MQVEVFVGSFAPVYDLSKNWDSINFLEPPMGRIGRLLALAALPLTISALPAWAGCDGNGGVDVLRISKYGKASFGNEKETFDAAETVAALSATRPNCLLIKIEDTARWKDTVPFVIGLMEMGEVKPANPQILIREPGKQPPILQWQPRLY